MPIAVENESGAANDFYGGGNSSYLKEEGVFHFIISHATDVPLDRNGGQIVNGLLQLQMTVASGPQMDKLFEHTFFGLKPDASDKQKAMQRRQLMRLAYACNLAGNAEVLAGKLQFEAADLIDKQLVMKVRFGTNQDGSKKAFLEISFSDIWHVDDPDAPKEAVIDAKVLGLLPQTMRRQAAYFEELKAKLKGDKGDGGDGGTAGSPAGGNKPSPTPAPKPKKSLADLV